MSTNRWLAGLAAGAIALSIAPRATDAQATVQTPAGTYVPVAPAGYVGANGTLTAASALPAVATTSAPASGCLVLKASPGNLYSVAGYVPSAGWLMVFNLAAPPSAGAVAPTNWVSGASAGMYGINFPTPQAMSAGAVICESSTGPYVFTPITANAAMTGQVQ